MRRLGGSYRVADTFPGPGDISGRLRLGVQVIGFIWFANLAKAVGVEGRNLIICNLSLQLQRVWLAERKGSPLRVNNKWFPTVGTATGVSMLLASKCYFSSLWLSYARFAVRLLGRIILFTYTFRWNGHRMFHLRQFLQILLLIFLQVSTEKRRQCLMASKLGQTRQ